MGNLQAFDGSPDATWTEILSKQEDHPSHPMAKVCFMLPTEPCMLTLNSRSTCSHTQTGSSSRLLVVSPYSNISDWTCIPCVFKWTQKWVFVSWSISGHPEKRVVKTLKWPPRRQLQEIVDQRLVRGHPWIVRQCWVRQRFQSKVRPRRCKFLQHYAGWAHLGLLRIFE